MFGACSTRPPVGPGSGRGPSGPRPSQATVRRPKPGVARSAPGPRCPQCFAPFWSPWGPLGL
eukprot:764903-Pyramimonas_sp.AAC.1